MSPTPDPIAPPVMLSEVRYSLPQLLKEIESERAAGALSMEKLDQTEIGKLFKTRTPPRRVKSRQ